MSHYSYFAEAYLIYVDIICRNLLTQLWNVVESIQYIFLISQRAIAGDDSAAQPTHVVFALHHCPRCDRYSNSISG